MTVYFELIDELSDGVVEFYTVKLGDKETFEFEEFENNEFPNHQNEIEVLYSVLEEIKRRGPYERYFKFEGNASALPKVSEKIINANEHDFGIRLYCIKIGNDKVVLLNGGIKTKLNPQECDNVRTHFNNARNIARVLDKHIDEKEINITDLECLNFYTLEI